MSTKELIKELTDRFYYIELDEFKELHDEVQELSKVIESNDLLLTWQAHRASPDKRFFCLPKANELYFVN